MSVVSDRDMQGESKKVATSVQLLSVPRQDCSKRYMQCTLLYIAQEYLVCNARGGAKNKVEDTIPQL